MSFYFLINEADRRWELRNHQTMYYQILKLVGLKKCMAIKMDNVDMSGFMKAVFKGDDIKINRKISLFPLHLFIFLVFQSEI